MTALSNQVRLAAWDRLAVAGPEGMPSSEIAKAISCSPTSMSAHLLVLSHAGLVTSKRRGRQNLYSARLDPVADLGVFISNMAAR